MIYSATVRTVVHMHLYFKISIYNILRFSFYFNFLNLSYIFIICKQYYLCKLDITSRSFHIICCYIAICINKTFNKQYKLYDYDDCIKLTNSALAKFRGAN